ncbi:MAG: hypothetical protein AAGE59_14175 [Cyanobacteria bacterium P01_F01_bin.86]
MTHSHNNRLDRIELLVEANAKAMEAMRIELRDGISDTIAMMTQLAEEAYQERIELKQRQEAADKRFETFLTESRADRAEMRAAMQRSEQQHEAANQRFNQFLAESRADRAEMREAMQRSEQQHEAANQRFNQFLAESRAERAEMRAAADAERAEMRAAADAERAEMREARQRNEQQHEATNQRFNQVLAEAQADRAHANQAQEEFRQVVRALLEKR